MIAPKKWILGAVLVAGAACARRATDGTRCSDVHADPVAAALHASNRCESDADCTSVSWVTPDRCWSTAFAKGPVEATLRELRDCSVSTPVACPTPPAPTCLEHACVIANPDGKLLSIGAAANCEEATNRMRAVISRLPDRCTTDRDCESERLLPTCDRESVVQGSNNATDVDLKVARNGIEQQCDSWAKCKPARARPACVNDRCVDRGP